MTKKAIMITSMDANRILSFDNIYITTLGTNHAMSTITNKYVPVKGDKIWFYPGCDIPRFKVKQFCQTAGVSVVKYRDKATIRFVGPEVLRTMISHNGARVVPKEYFLTWLDSVMCNAYEELRKQIAECESDTVYLDSQVSHKFCNKDIFMNKIMYPKASDSAWRSFNYVSSSNYDAFISVLNDPQLRNQDDLLELLNTGAVLDEEMFNQIHRLFESTDKDNTKLAMEAMANCDFQQSAVYLLLLMKKYGDKMDSAANRHHVNFKSLLKYFDIRSLHNIDVDSMMSSLIRQKLLNIDNLNKLMPFIMEEVRQHGDLGHIKIKDVELTPEVEKAISENILDQRASLNEETEETSQDSNSNTSSQSSNLASI